MEEALKPRNVRDGVLGLYLSLNEKANQAGRLVERKQLEVFDLFCLCFQESSSIYYMCMNCVSHGRKTRHLRDGFGERFGELQCSAWEVWEAERDG